jgi:hypothetical protein
VGGHAATSMLPCNGDSGRLNGLNGLLVAPVWRPKGFLAMAVGMRHGSNGWLAFVPGNGDNGWYWRMATTGTGEWPRLVLATAGLNGLMGRLRGRPRGGFGASLQRQRLNGLQQRSAERYACGARGGFGGSTVVG